ncbi:MAG: alpha/beta hydrolase [Oligoflexia bacterium]|nr:alpha/beta hydrolase [Oligoflexia bacterium]
MRHFRLLKRLLQATLSIYLLIVLGFWLFQRSLIFKPQLPGEITPLTYGVPYQDLYMRNPDGLKLHAWWVPQADTPTAPVLLYCHGNAAELSALAEVASIFHSWGLSALLFDYRSYGQSEVGALTESALLADARTAYAFLQEQVGSENSILVWGHSLGSSVAANLVAVLSADKSIKRAPAGLIMEGAFSNMYDVGRYRYPWLLLFPFMLKDPFDTAGYLARSSTPKLFLHAERDAVIPLYLGEKAYAAASGSKQRIILSNIDHNDFPLVQEQYRARVMEFIERSVASAKGS